MGAQQVAQNVADGAGDGNVEHHQAVYQIGKEAGVVAGHVQHLAVSVGGAQIKAHQGGKGNDGKGAGARTHDAIVQADAKADAQRQQGLFQVQGAVVPVLVRQLALPQDDHRCHRQDDEHHGAQHLVTEQQHDVCPQCTARKAADGCKNAHLHVYCAVLKKADGSSGGAASGAELVGGIGVVGRQPGEQIGRQADQPAAAGCRIHKACKAGHQHEKRHHPRRDRDTHCYNSSYLSKSFVLFQGTRASDHIKPPLAGQYTARDTRTQQGISGHFCNFLT